MGLFSYEEGYDAYSATPVSNQFISEYLPHAKGDDVRVYLYGLMLCSRQGTDERLTIDDIARQLGLTTEAVLLSFRHWEFVGLVHRTSDNPPMFEYIHPVRRSQRGESWQNPKQLAFIEAVHAVFGADRTLTSEETRTICEWHEVYRMPEDVVLALLRYLKENKGKHFSMKAAEKTAALLMDRNVQTVEEFSEVIGQEQAALDGARSVLRRFGKKRQPTQDEVALYSRWITEWGYTPDAILAACSETTKGEPNFAYLDGILRGMLKRSGTAATSAAQVESSIREEKSRVEQVRHFIREAGLGQTVTVDDAMLSIYAGWLADYPEAVILKAATLCRDKRNDQKLERVSEILQFWKQSGLRTEAEIDAYMRHHDEQSRRLHQLSELWGMDVRAGKADRAMLDQWLETWAMPWELVLHCAVWAAQSSKPMPYLNRILEKLHEHGVHTVEEADRQRGERAGRDTSSVSAGKILPAQNYRQRDYVPENQAVMPEWLSEMLKEEQHAQ